MTTMWTMGARFGFALLGTGLALGAAPARAAQPAYGQPVYAQPNYGQTAPDDPLARYLRAIAENPRDAAALAGAGKAALQLGDAQGALTFFGRAEEVLPSDGRIKMLMGSALVQLEQPAAALKFFRDAVALGIPEGEVAGDRGLAYDISGDPRRAQRDYRLALARGGEPEITRRLALSLAITGERAAALAMLDDQLAARDRAAQRTRALVLALTGDWAGADRLVEAAMPAPQAAAMDAFLNRLPTLNARDKALAVHLGHFPQAGRASPPDAYARSEPVALPPGYTPVPEPKDAGRPDESRPAFGRAAAAQAEAPRRIPGEGVLAPAVVVPPARAAARPAPPRKRDSENAAPTPLMNQWAWSRGEMTTARRPARETRPADAKPPERVAARSAPPPPPSSLPRAQPVETARADPPARPRPIEIARADPQPGVIPSFDRETARVSRSETARPVPETALPAPAPVPAATSRLAEVAAALDRLDGQAQAQAQAQAQVQAQPRAAPPGEAPPPHARASSRMASISAAVDKPARARPKQPVAPRDPSRHWVQVAGGAKKEGLPRAFARLKEKAPKLLDGRNAWTTPLNATNRLLVGPFDSDEEAQSFVNKLAKADLSAFAWTSDEGQRIERLPAR
jgi:Flp pilus assembly protein TadD